MSKKIFETSNAPLPIGSYCQSMKVGDFVFCSGQIPIDPQTGQIVSEDIKQQTKQVIENIRAVLLSAGLDLKHVVKITIFLTSMEDYSQVNEVYASYFSAPFWPTRSCVQVAGLPQNAKIEIEALASTYST